jgi:lipoprotein-releasing system permease protein
MLGVRRPDRADRAPGYAHAGRTDPRLRQFTIVAVFDAGHYEYDTSLVLVHIEDAARLFRVEGVSGCA